MCQTHRERRSRRGLSGRTLTPRPTPLPYPNDVRTRRWEHAGRSFSTRSAPSPHWRQQHRAVGRTRAPVWRRREGLRRRRPNRHPQGLRNRRRPRRFPRRRPSRRLRNRRSIRGRTPTSPNSTPFSTRPTPRRSGSSSTAEWFTSGTARTRRTAATSRRRRRASCRCWWDVRSPTGCFTLDTHIDDVLGTRWTPHGQSAGITVRQLLTMTSGLDDQFAVIARPGTMWRYSGAFAALFDVLTTTTGRPLNEIADDWLFDPAGASTAQFYERRSDGFAPVGLFARARDLTAIGQMVIDQHAARSARCLASTNRSRPASRTTGPMDSSGG